MKKHLYLLGCVLGLMLIPARAAEEEETELGKHMEAMNDAFKLFRRETDPVKGATQAREAQQQALKSAMEIPAMLKPMPEGPDKEKAVLEYRKMMGKLFITLCDVEGAFLAGKPEEVAKILETLKELKKTGHDKFIKEEE